MGVNPNLIEARAVQRSFDHGAVQALRGVDLEVRAGEFIAIMGPSGSGKSTLLNVLGALDGDFEGSMMIADTDLRRLPRPEQFRARVIGFVFQSFCLLPTLTALENVQVPMFEMPWSRTKRRDRAATLLDSLGLADRRDHIPAKLSGGERQRVAIARSLANGPRLLLADEPAGNLDRASAERILAVLDEIHRREGMTIIMVTHDPQVAARAGRTLHILDGRIVDSPAGTDPAPRA